MKIIGTYSIPADGDVEWFWLVTLNHVAISARECDVLNQCCWEAARLKAPGYKWFGLGWFHDSLPPQSMLTNFLGFCWGAGTLRESRLHTAVLKKSVSEEVFDKI
jgi:hypothetical protein